MPADAERVDTLASDVVEWCQSQIADTRRPYGIDQVALAVACAEPGGEAISSATFGIFRPVDFYRDGGVAERVGDFIRETGDSTCGSARRRCASRRRCSRGAMWRGRRSSATGTPRPKRGR